MFVDNNGDKISPNFIDIPLGFSYSTHKKIMLLKKVIAQVTSSLLLSNGYICNKYIFLTIDTKYHEYQRNSK